MARIIVDVLGKQKLILNIIILIKHKDSEETQKKVVLNPFKHSVRFTELSA